MSSRLHPATCPCPVRSIVDPSADTAIVEVIGCAAPLCVVRGPCSLKGLLDEANEAFYDALDRNTLADAAASLTGAAIVRLHRRSRSA